MGKSLEEMTLEELWELFPVVLVPHRPQWLEWAGDEIKSLSELLRDYTPVITHIGSTAIAGIQAKPIVDILVEISPDADWRRARAMMEGSGYICMSASGYRMSFNKGYTPEGYAERVFHVHIHAVGDNDEIIFRDYLNSHPTVAREYEALKLSLLPRYSNDRDGYTAAKTEFVNKIMALAKGCCGKPIFPVDVLKYCLDNLDGVVAVDSWGERGIFYNPGGVLKRGVYVLTVKEKDGENDRASMLDREGVWRVNIGVRRSTFHAMFGGLPGRPVKGGVVDVPYDFATKDVIMPHPIYAWMGWICVLNPSDVTFRQLMPLITEAYGYAVEKFHKRR